MKKFLFVFAILIFCSCISFAQDNYEQFKQERKACYSNYSSKCFYKLMNKYSSNSKIFNIAKYDYGSALMSEKEYIKAKNTFHYILANEKENEKLINLTKEGLNKIKEHEKNVFKANSKDTGNYYDKSQSAKWENPKNLKVYIKGRTGKEYLMVNAFRTWMTRTNRIVSFTFINKQNGADITCQYVDTLGKEYAGYTNTHFYTKPNGEKYIKNANIKISLTNVNGGKYADKNLESIALHEIGHALGISNHSENINDIMYYSTETYKNGTLSRRDVNTAKMLYSK